MYEKCVMTCESLADECEHSIALFNLGDALRALLGLCLVHLQRGNVAVAKTYADRAHTLAQEGDARPELAHSLYALGEIATAQDRSTDAAAFYRAAFEAHASHFPERAARDR